SRDMKGRGSGGQVPLTPSGEAKFVLSSSPNVWGSGDGSGYSVRVWSRKEETIMHSQSLLEEEEAKSRQGYMPWVALFFVRVIYFLVFWDLSVQLVSGIRLHKPFKQLAPIQSSHLYKLHLHVATSKPW